MSILQKHGVAAEIFNLWFQMLQQTKRSGLRANFRRWLQLVVHLSFFFLGARKKSRVSDSWFLGVAGSMTRRFAAWV